MEIDIIDTSKITEYPSNTFRTTIPLAIIEKFDLLDGILKNKEFLTYKIIKYPKILILTLKELSRDEIIKINKYFSTSEMVQRFLDIKIYINKPNNHYAMKLDNKVYSYLNLKADRLISYATLEINDTKYLIIKGDLKIKFE